MIVRKAFKFKLKTTPAQNHQLANIAGCCRFAWNKFHALNQARLSKRQRIMRYHEMDFWTKRWKASDEYGFLADCPAQVLQQKLLDLDRAYRDGFDKQQPLKRLPKMRKRGIHDSFRFPAPKQFVIDGRRIKLPKLGWVRFFKSCNIIGTPRNLTISRCAADWYVSIQVEYEVANPIHPGVGAIGVDLGIDKFAAFSTGDYLEPISSYRIFSEKLGKFQAKLARQVKFSGGWRNTKKRIQLLHRRIANCRRDFLHKASTTLSKNHAMIVVEALNITNMSKSSRGTLEEPGKQVRAKSGLNKSILDQGWGEFRRQLHYKQTWRSGLYIEVAPQYTSQTCAVCGYCDRDNRKRQADFRCKRCGHKDNADVNAAKNILAAGHAVLACESSHIGGRKQESLGKSNQIPAFH